MKLRKLKLKDAPHMLEWMHDKNVIERLRGNFLDKTIVDCEEFIRASKKTNNDIHLAIVSDNDEYMGTVSLKSIDQENKSAEFAITVRRCAMGKGYSWWGMEEIIRLAFEKYNLESVYWCVSRANERAVRFYEKHNFHETIDILKSILNRYAGMDDLKWYSVLKGDALEERM